MRLILTETGKEPTHGQEVKTSRGENVIFVRGVRPHKSNSEGFVHVIEGGREREYYASVIGAKWIEREDRP